jgi:hypothetical protein
MDFRRFVGCVCLDRLRPSSCMHSLLFLGNGCALHSGITATCILIRWQWLHVGLKIQAFL